MNSVRRLTSGDENLWSRATALLTAERDRDGRLAPEHDLTRALADPRCYLFVAMPRGVILSAS